MKTDSMTKFDYLFLGAMIVDLFTVIAAWDVIILAVQNDVLAQGAGLEQLQFTLAITPWAYAFTFGLGLLLWTLVSVFRVGFVRYIIAVFTLLTALSVLAELALQTTGLFLQATALVSLMMNVAALVFVFQEDATAWIRREA